MDWQAYADPRLSSNEPRASPVQPHAEVNSPTRPKAPGGVDGGAILQSGNIIRRNSETPTGKFPAPGVFQKSGHLPTPQSPRNVTSYLVTRNPNSGPSTHSCRPESESTELPREFQAYTSSASPPFRPHSIPTPESSPLVARSRGYDPHSLPQSARPGREDTNVPDSPSRASTPPRPLLQQIPTRFDAPVSQSHPTTILQWRPTGAGSDGSTAGFHDTKDEPGRIRSQPIESHLASSRETESHRPDYFKRLRRLAPSSNLGTGATADLDGQDGSLLWSAANVGVIDSPVKGKRIALFQETSEESFEESLMAGGYGRYRSDGPWKLEEDAEAPNELGEIREQELGSRLESTEDEQRKKARLAAFRDSPRSGSSIQLLPVEIAGCGRVLMKVEPPEPQTPPKPTPKAKRSRKRKKSADMKPELNEDNIAAPEESAVDAPNWPDTEFPWRSRLVAQDGLWSWEREERLRQIESFLDRDSDEDAAEEGDLLSGRRSPDELSSRSPWPGRGKTYPLFSHRGDRRCGAATLSTIPSDPADARAALLSKKSIRAIHLRLLRRQETNRGDSEDGEVLCLCRGRDDGRPLVQCDACRMWYHLECIGIQSTSELGREEDPWFCANCDEVKTSPAIRSLTEPAFVSTDGDEHDAAGGRGGVDLEGYDPPFLNAGINPSPGTPWTRSRRLPTTPPRSQYAPHTTWDEPPSSSTRGEPRTPQFDSASGFGDMVRVASSWTGNDESPFDPTSTPSRGIRFGLPFTTPKEGRWGPEASLWPGVRGSELFHTPKQPGEDGGAATTRHGPPTLYHGRVREVSEEPSGLHGATGRNNVTPIERDPFGGPKRMQVLDSPLGAKRSKRNINAGS